MLKVDNMGSFLKGLQSMRNLPEVLVRRKLQKVLRLIHEKVTIRTPVYTGASLRNWVWSMDTPSSSANQPAIGGVDPGQTSKMSLGSEPRRPANQAAVDASFAALDLSKPLRSYWLSNRSANILDLEYGKLPTPGRSRNPAGMAAVTFQEALALLSK